VSEAHAWLDRAAADLAAARFLRTNPGIPAVIASFHYLQCAEKALKGVVILRGSEPPRIHALGRLLELAASSAQLDADTADLLTPCAVVARYPGFEVGPTTQDLDRFDHFAACALDLLRVRLAAPPPDTAEPPPDTAEMPPDTAGLPPDTAELPPDTAEPLPDAAELLPDAAELLPDAAEMPPDAAELPPDTD